MRNIIVCHWRSLVSVTNFIFLPFSRNQIVSEIEKRWIPSGGMQSDMATRCTSYLALGEWVKTNLEKKLKILNEIESLLSVYYAISRQCKRKTIYVTILIGCHTKCSNVMFICDREPPSDKIYYSRFVFPSSFVVLTGRLDGCFSIFFSGKRKGIIAGICYS